MATLRLNPLIHQTRRVNPRSRHELQKQGVSVLNYSKISSVGVFCTFRTRVSIRASSVETFVETSESAEVLFAETFSLKRTETVEGKVSVRLKNGKDNRNWQLTVGCTLPGKWVLHWGVTYCGDLGSEWDQPPREMIPSGSIPIKGYAIETPLKQSPSGVEGQMLHEVRIDCSRDNSISAINFVLKEEETGAWFQHRGRDFRVHLTDYIQGNDGVVDDKKGFSIWSGTLFPPNLSQMSNMLLKTQGSQSNEKDNAIGSNDAKQQNIRVEGFYEEYSILKEIPVQNFLTVSVRKSEEKDKSLVFFDTDLHGDVVIHWGVCRDSDKKWEIPVAPHPPKTLIYRHKALQTLLQPKGNANGSRGSFSLDKEFVGLLFVLKINEYTYLNNMGSDFYIPILAKSSEAAQTGRNLMEGENIQSGITVDSEQGNIKEGSGPSLIEESEQENQLTNGIISEIRNLISDISSVKSRKTKSKEDQESILQEIEKLAAEAYSIFRSSLPMFVEPASSAQTLLPRKLSSGTGSGYEVLCQGFNWESHKSERWYCDLYEKAAEISSLGFTIIWLPPPTESVSPEGYMPKDLYNLNSRYGSMEELKHLVKRFHEMGVKVLGDVVLNHRCASYKNQNGVWNLFGGRLNWDDRAIVADDPHFQGRGNKGSGDNFHAAPNIDHSQDFVRNDIKEWLQWLRKEIGYDGWRLDFARGFWGGYVKDYLDASEPYFAVGEYWDSLNYTYGDMDHNQDAHRQRIVDWINATNGTAGAFDVTTKGILHSALEKCEYWRLSDEKGKPPGVVGWWPSRAVTFIENHDTGSTQGHWRFPPGKEMQGYAYILTHPGTPAVFYDHIFSHYREEIFSLISLRHRAKIHCRSASLPQPIRDEASSHPEYISQYILRKPEISDPVKITKAERDVYAAHIEGKLAMKIGPGHYEPSNGSQIWVLAAEGRDYKVWLAS